MSSQGVDIFSMLNKAQTEFNQQQNSVAAFFRQASTNGAVTNNNAPTRSMPMPIKNLNSLEQIERQIRTSPPSIHDAQNNNALQATNQTNDLANSPLAQFFNSNNLNNTAGFQAPTPEVKAPQEKLLNGQKPKVTAPPGFNNKVQPQQKNLLSSVNKETTKLITPTMFTPSNNNEKKSPVAEPLTKNQLLQALNYLIENDDDFMKKVHEAYIKSLKGLAS
ncbi:CLUMA_CG001381, isoform A [Clunio marinus]|uniref:CLUMA_CG001381, isoform A n=1 Tax=Clunio marinus TaxID=568069 RepID=A0A1J1HHS1_9DIPT|nr:CLUMA_CG001381, isoform A [Clunio marinus]